MSYSHVMEGASLESTCNVYYKIIKTGKDENLGYDGPAKFTCRKRQILVVFQR